MSELPGAAPATDHDEGSPRVVISGLNRTAFDLAVYASQGWSPTHHARLASGCWSGSTGRDWLPAGFHLKGFKLPTILLSRAFLRDVSSFFVLVGLLVSVLFSLKKELTLIIFLIIFAVDRVVNKVIACRSWKSSHESNLPT